MTWIRFPSVAVLAAALLLAGTVAVAARDGGGPSNKNHGRASHSSSTVSTNDGGTSATGGAATAVGGSSGQAGTGASTSLLSAKTSTTHHGATVTKDLGCGILTPPFGSVTATDSIFVLTPSGHAVLVCKGDLPAGIGPTSAIVIDGLVCNAPGVAPTTRSHTTITPSGEVNLTCHFPS